MIWTLNINFMLFQHRSIISPNPGTRTVIICTSTFRSSACTPRFMIGDESCRQMSTCRIFDLARKTSRSRSWLPSPNRIMPPVTSSIHDQRPDRSASSRSPREQYWSDSSSFVYGDDSLLTNGGRGLSWRAMRDTFGVQTMHCSEKLHAPVNVDRLCSMYVLQHDKCRMPQLW